MINTEIETSLYRFIKPKYPDVEIKVQNSDENIRQVFFTASLFKDLYPQQRYHYLIHLIPGDFIEENLTNTEWFELAPGEDPDELDYHDDEMLEEITESVLGVLQHKVDFVSILDRLFMKEDTACCGDFSHSKKILKQLDFPAEAQFDIFHVLMKKGGYCDCEILFNVFRESEYAQKYWSSRS
ncbi:DUF2695 domain-containing protein [Ferruginibacter paludis]|uniref:DUF2695 domain-containing protein n=1 Tax=Ferruginibacter paludis TaxID=1310417 RepID=UPI0025B2CC91|nr:DUF2695 domain-containing protein [Ferruginibacter paludis]MDN3659026.1 DUF2695 domain-containing protein [Ferruginibacter paludis]